MRGKSLRASFDAELVGFVENLFETAEQAFEQALANIEPPTRCAGVHLHQVQWHNGEPVAVRLYIERNAGAGSTTDA